MISFTRTTETQTISSPTQYQLFGRIHKVSILHSPFKYSFAEFNFTELTINSIPLDINPVGISQIPANNTTKTAV